MNMLKIIKYFFDQYVHNDNLESQEDSFQAFQATMQKLGIPRHLIEEAFTWLDEFAQQLEDHETESLSSHHQAHRIFNREECYLLDTKCRGLLRSLEHADVINPECREMIIDRVIAIGKPISIDQLKWLIMLVTSNLHESYQPLSILEEVLFPEPREAIH